MSARKYLDDTGLTSLWAKIINKINALGDSLASVAFSGSYNDLTDKPTVAEIDDNSTANNKAWSASKIGTDLGRKVSKSGDTMTGALTMNNANVNVKDTDINIGTNPSSVIWGNGFYAQSNNAGDLWYLRSTQDTSGNAGVQLEVQRTVNGTRYYHNMRIGIANDGALTTYFSNPASWRSAIGHPFTWDINTNNTSDTWVPVLTGSTLQHRVIPTDYNNKIIGEDNHAASTGAALSSDTGRIGLHWYSQTGKIKNQPTQYGFLLTCATAKGSVEQHSIFMEQANGSLYHMGTNGSSSGSPPAYKKIWDSGNLNPQSALSTVDVSFTRSHASVSYQEGLKCWRYGNVVTFGGWFSCGATIAANTILYSNLPKPKGDLFFTWSGYDFNLRTDGTIRTNGQIISRTYNAIITYVCT